MKEELALLTDEDLQIILSSIIEGKGKKGIPEAELQSIAVKAAYDIREAIIQVALWELLKKGQVMAI